MNNFYTQEEYFQKVKKNKINALVASLVLLIGIILFFVISLFAKDSFKFVMYVICTLILGISAIIFSYLLIEVVIPNKRHNKFVYHLLTANRYEGTFKVTSISSAKIISKGIQIIEIGGVNDEGKSCLYYFETGLDFTFKIESSYKVMIAKNFILEVEEDSND